MEKSEDQVIASEVRTQLNFPVGVRAAARFISVIFHPLFIPVYLILFIIYEAGYFPDRTNWQKKLIVIQFLVSYTIMPLLTILLMKGLGFIQSVQLRERKERILPYVVCEIFYFWVWYVCKNQDYDRPVITLTLGIFLASSIGLILNSYQKISMHGLSVGVLATFVLMTGFHSTVSYGLYTSIAFLIAGLTLSARLIDSNHSVREIYTGFFAGVLSLIAASLFS